MTPREVDLAGNDAGEEPGEEGQPLGMTDPGSEPPVAPATLAAVVGRGALLALDTTSAAVALALVGAVLTGAPDLVRLPLALAFMSFVPGWSLTANLPNLSRRSVFAVPAALSLSICAALATITLWTGAWHPRDLFFGEAGVSLFGLLVAGLRHRGGSRAVPGAPDGDLITEPRLRSWRPRTSDALVVASVVFWALALRGIRPSAGGLEGLAAALPAAYYAALGLVLVSTALLLGARRLSSWRLAVHLAVLIAILYATAPAVLAEPRYTWLYKHIGVTQYIAAHGHLNASIDIYQNWPGMFALAAWIDRVSGVGSPLLYAAWAQPFFEVLYALELSWIVTALPLKVEERWLALFVFASANWIAQDYFSPQGLGYVLSLAVMGLALRYFKPGTPIALVRWLERLLGRLLRARAPDSRSSAMQDSAAVLPEDAGRPELVAALAVTLFVFFVLTFVHELSPYMIIVQLGVLAVLRLLQRRWAIVAMGAIAVAYFVPRAAFVAKTYGIFASIGNFFGNIRPPHVASYGHVGAAARETDDLANLLTLIVVLLAFAGALRLLKQGRSMAALVVVAFSPAVLLAIVAYGNEGILRIYLFALPWLAVLAACALASSRGRRRYLGALWPAVTLVLLGALFTRAFFGNGATDRVSRADVAASTYLYYHTRPGPVMSLAGNFPANIGSTYPVYKFVPSLLGSGIEGAEPLRARKDVATVQAVLEQYGGGTARPGYFVTSSTDLAYAEEYGLATAAQVASFLRALAEAPGWRLDFSHGEAAVYELLPRH
jgi:hypothetical protein